MILAKIAKNHVQISIDGTYIGSVWADKVELDIKDSGRPMLTLSNHLNGWLSFIHPDEITFKPIKPADAITQLDE